MKRYTIERVYLPTETLGSWYDEFRNVICKTMELPWRNNQKDNPNTTENDASCIPEGLYIVEKQPANANRPYGYFRFRAIEGRTINRYVKDMNGNFMSAILVHRITFVKDLLGCIGVGSRFHDFNNDGVPDMEQSGDKLRWMHENLPDVFELEIKKKAA